MVSTSFHFLTVYKPFWPQLQISGTILSNHFLRSCNDLTNQEWTVHLYMCNKTIWNLKLSNVLLLGQDQVVRHSRNCNSSRLQIFFKIDVLKNFTIFTVKHLWRSATLLKKRPQHKCFLVNITKFLGIDFFIEHLQ